MFEKLKRKVGKTIKLVFNGIKFKVEIKWRDAFMEEILVIIDPEEYKENFEGFVVQLLITQNNKIFIHTPIFSSTEEIKEERSLIKALKNEGIL